MKRTVSALLIFALALALCIPAFAEKADRSFEGGVFKLTTAEDFSLGELENAVVDETIGNGAVKLSEGAMEGSFVSDVIGVEPFEYLVASWNADMPAGAELEVFVRAYVDMKDEWSGWLSWGVWESGIKRASGDAEDDFAYVDVDTFTVKGQDGETASLVQMKAELRANEAGESPVLRQLAATYKNTLDGQAVVPQYYGEAMELPESVKLDTPAYSQQIRERSIAGVMCSATTICVLLNDRGEDALPEEIALLDYDFYYDGFGNWSYSVAAAGAYGYDAWCQYADLDVVKQELAHGYSVGLSVKYSDSESGSYPYLEGAPISGTAGHLITITGYETVDGMDYFFSSDSAANTDDQCFRRYRADQLDNAWSGHLAYMVREKEDAPTLAPNRIAATLEPAEGAENAYKLMVNGEQVSLTRSFSAGKLKAEGNGIIACYIVDDAMAPAMPEGVKVTTANENFRYAIAVNEDGTLKINPEQVLTGYSEPEAKVRVFVMVNDGTTYEAELELLNAAAATPEPTAAPTEEPAPAATAAPAATEEPVTGASGKETEFNEFNWTIIAIVAVVAIVAAFIVRGYLNKKEAEANKGGKKK